MKLLFTFDLIFQAHRV